MDALMDFISSRLDDGVAGWFALAGLALIAFTMALLALAGLYHVIRSMPRIGRFVADAWLEGWRKSS